MSKSKRSIFRNMARDEARHGKAFVGLLKRYSANKNRKDEVMGFFGKLFVGFLAVVALLGIIGLIITKRRTAQKGTSTEGRDEVLPEKTVKNVLDVNDRFNRARYMDEDGSR